MGISTKTIAMVAAFTAASFATQAGEKVTGSYGVYKGDPSDIRLTLNDDHTFTYSYVYFGKPKRQNVTVAGKWAWKGGKVVLHKENSLFHIPKKWRFAKDGQVAKGRMGMCYYRICKV